MSRPRLGSAALAVVLLAVGACGSTEASTDLPSVVDGTGAPGGADGGAGGPGPIGGGVADAASGAKPCATNADCGGGECNLDTKTCGCGGQNVGAELVAPNLLLVLDRSCSMDNPGGGGKTKWQVAVAAISNLTQAFAGRIRFGLTLFPDKTPPSCEQGAIPIPVASGTEPAIRKMLGDALSKSDPLFPDGPCVTNIDTAVAQAQTEPAFADKTRASFVALIGDGEQANCGGGGGDPFTEQTLKNMRTAGVGTFVIGFGTGSDSKSLNTFAAAGGQARPGPTKYYDAADQTALEAALQTIAKATLGCDLKLAAPPPGGDASQIFVFFDGKAPAVPRDVAHADGWDYDGATQTVRFYGATCQRMKDGTVTRQSVVFGCPGSNAPPPPR